MMCKERITQLMDSSGIPWDFLLFDIPQTPPYALVLTSDSSNVSSDFETLEEIHGYTIELYYRTLEAREAFEQHLMDSHVVWERVGTDTWLDSERVYYSQYEL